MSRNGDDRQARPDLPDKEVEDIEKRVAPRATIVHEAIRLEGRHELARSSSALGWSAIAAGLSMGFSLVAEGLLHDHLPAAQWRPLITKFGYSVGFLIVILGRQQLFTENTLTPVLHFLSRWELKIFFQMLRLWAVVLCANLAGAYVFAWLLAHTGVFGAETLLTFSTIGHELMEKDFWTMFSSAIFAGWLIALTIWLMPFAETARVVIIILITYMIGLGGFSHIIAGSVEVFFLVATQQLSWISYLVDFCLPTLAGNVLGGIALVAVINHAQVVADDRTEK